MSTTTPKLTAIITAHKDTPLGMIQNLKDQTVRPNKLLVGVSDWVSATGFSAEIPIYYEIMSNSNDFGYKKRNKMLKMVEDEFVGFFNHDDSYELSYVEKMLSAAVEHNADVVCCGWDRTDHLKKKTATILADFKPFVGTLGAFIVRTDVMLEIGGFPTEINDEVLMLADFMGKWDGIEAENIKLARGMGDARAIWLLRRWGAKVIKVPQTLYHSNVPYKGIAKPMTWGR